MTLHLETQGLTIRFGGHVAVDSVSCSFRPGELTAIVGPNGAGKTTYFNLMSGQLRATSGSVSVSYTHLDVYKRQPNMCRNWKKAPMAMPPSGK